MYENGSTKGKENQTGLRKKGSTPGLRTNRNDDVEEDGLADQPLCADHQGHCLRFIHTTSTVRSKLFIPFDTSPRVTKGQKSIQRFTEGLFLGRSCERCPSQDADYPDVPNAGAWG